MNWEERFDAFPYFKRASWALRIFFSLLFAALLCEGLRLEFLTGVFGMATIFAILPTIIILYGVKLTGGGPDGDSLKVSKMAWRDRFNALPYSERAGWMLHIFLPLFFAALLCEGLRLESLTGVFGMATFITTFPTIGILCGMKLTGGGPDKDSLKVSKMTSAERFNALPYSKRVGKALRIFFSLAVATGICAALELKGLAGFFMLVSGVSGFGAIIVLCGGKVGPGGPSNSMHDEWSDHTNPASPYYTNPTFPNYTDPTSPHYMDTTSPNYTNPTSPHYMGTTSSHCMDSSFPSCTGSSLDSSFPNYTDPTSPHYMDHWTLLPPTVWNYPTVWTLVSPAVRTLVWTLIPPTITTVNAVDASGLKNNSLFI